MSSGPHSRTRASAVSRRSLVLGSLAVLSGCSLRLEKNAHIPGPKAQTPTDIAPLRAVHTRLSELIDETGRASQHTAQAHPLAALHRRQLAHVDATLKGLGAPESPTASGSSPASGKQQPLWTSTENEWVSDSQLHLLASISSDSRPMAVCIAATGLAATDSAGSGATWSSEAVFPSANDAPANTAVAAAIDAFEWVASHTESDKRGSLPQTLSWLYGVRAMIQAADNSSPTSGPAPLRRYRDVTTAKQVAVTALKDLLPACATAAKHALTTQQAEGVLLAWSKTIRELDRQGSPDKSAFPGLSTTA